MSPTDAAASGGSGRERRAYFRVRAYLPLRHRPLQPGERETLRAEMSTPRPEPEVEEGLSTWLCQLEEKLDLVLSHLDPAAQRPLCDRDRRVVEISGSGLSFPSKERIRVGESLLVELRLPGGRPRPVRALAEVVERREADDPWGESRVAVAFREIHEDDREAIVRFSNDLQRLELRARATSQESA